VRVVLVVAVQMVLWGLTLYSHQLLHLVVVMGLLSEMVVRVVLVVVQPQMEQAVLALQGKDLMAALTMALAMLAVVVAVLAQ
jgi:hypothetical protein